MLCYQRLFIWVELHHCCQRVCNASSTTSEAPLIPKFLTFQRFVRICMEYLWCSVGFSQDWILQALGELAASCRTVFLWHIKTTFLKILDMSPMPFLRFLVLSGVYKPWVSKLHPTGASSRMKIAFLDFLGMDLLEKTKSIFRRVVDLAFRSWGLDLGFGI